MKHKKKDDNIVIACSHDFTDYQNIKALEEDKIKTLKSAMEQAVTWVVGK